MPRLKRKQTNKNETDKASTSKVNLYDGNTDLENAMVMDAAEKSEAITVEREKNLNAERRPSEESITMLAARRTSARQAHRLYLKQHATRKENSKHDYFETGQASTLKENLCNENQDVENIMQLDKADTSEIPDARKYEADADDFIVERRATTNTGSKNHVTKKTLAVARENVRAEERPSKESIARLAARRTSARQAQQLHLKQQATIYNIKPRLNRTETLKKKREKCRFRKRQKREKRKEKSPDIENAMVLNTTYISEAIPVARANVHSEERPSKESIAKLAVRRTSARQAHRLYLKQHATIKENCGHDYFETGQASTSKENLCNENQDVDKPMEFDKPDIGEILKDARKYKADDFIEERRAIKNTGLKNRVTEKTLAGDITTGEYGNVQKYVMSELNVKCAHCGAVRFAEQKGRSVHSCCHNDQVTLPPLKQYPPELHNLLISGSEDAQHFRQRIRAYNSSFAFATFGAHLEDMQKGPPLIKIQGQVYHHATTSLANVNDNMPRNGQIYVYDDVEAASRMRMDLDRPDLNIRLERLMREINPYAQKYKMLRDMTINGEEYVLHFVKYAFDDKRRYNRPTTSEVAMMIISKDGSVPSVDLKVYPKQEHNRETTIINQTSQHADPMTFPLLFPHGDFGWTYNMKTKKGKKISPVQYYGHRLALRPDESFNPLLNAGRLTQQYVINCYVMVERQRLDYIRYNQSRLRTECYQGIVDHVEKNVLNAADEVRLGTAVILPATYIGSPRSLQQLYQDSMAICRKIGRPDYFITMTCNPRWTEITHTLNRYFVKGTTVNDIPTIVTDIFQTKVKELIRDLIERNVLGPIVDYVYTIEFQKRGLPHAHILAALRTDCKLLQPKDVDRFITAELSDTDSSLRYYQLRHMMHGPHVDGLICWDKENKVCSKNFPKPFCEETDMTGDGFPRYMRRDNTGKMYAYHARPNGKVQYVDNRMVVPHNPYLLKKFDCHLNVEYCSSEMAIKYIHKYIHKGHDRARMEMKNEESDEVKKYIDSRYVGPMEAAWRLNELPLHDRSHSVIRLPVHLDGQQYITFEEGREEAAVHKDCKTMLLGWFDLNKQDPSARKILYGNVTDSYSWKAKDKKWIPRIRNAKVVGRIVSVSPRDSERFHLKLILNRIPGATCYQDLRTHDNVVHKTFREAAIAMGITECSDEAIAVLEEAAKTLMPKQMRRFFVYYLIGDEPSDACQLWERFQLEMIDFGTTSSEALCDIEALLNSENRTCEDFGLNKPDIFNVPVHHTDVSSHLEKCQEIEDKFNVEQLAVYHRIIDSISGDCQQPAQCFFIDGPGGTGKTFLYTGIYHRLLAMSKNTACVAWTGIASILLPCGTTSHRFFNLPIQLTEEGICYTKPRDKRRLQEVDVVIWDEASMIPRKALEIIDRTLRDVMNNSLPFGGKTFILGGDFRQVLPVVKKATRSQIVSECIKSSYLWKLFEIHHLKVNMRVTNGAGDFADWLLQFGNGELEELAIEESFASADLAAWFFEDLENISSDLINRIILSPQNQEVNRMNENILSKIPGEEKVSYSIDKATLSGIDKSDAREEEATLRYSDEYLHSLTPPGMPPHKLKLKIGCIVMLIRNLCIADGLCNGTRLLVLKIQTRVLTLKIITGDKKGTVVDIPRIQLNTSGDSQLPFVLYRRQFPVRLAFALTINKSQGQTFQRVGIYIDRPIFAHGQLYVALSRCVSLENIKLFVKEAHIVKNIVYKEILE